MMSLHRSRRYPVPGTSTGFTLLEVMVVVIVIGVLLTFATLSVNVGGNRALDTETKRLRALFQLVSDEAVLQGKPLFLQILPDGYRFVELSEDRKWEPVEHDRLLGARQLSDGISIRLLVDGATVALLDEENPAILAFLSSAELMPPFVMQLTTDDQGTRELRGTEDAQFAVVGPTDGNS